ncbi:hypothetical protein HPC49_52570 [Pyxidicoccus fallax]|uniref:Lipoprotein n=1 Tax=Pyxidicoccus fallax TaxID=394095 RepID=A0A848LXG3_9BACT|nr:beta-propeller domain-containing protein [Pyxidicoccus fallax]NMO21944.1 hypothetical protein [Pyxidicoccus fallax]NPC86808.1 hypothetical protein [Pyxidicoccus fallax]
MRQWKRLGWMGLAVVAAGCGDSDKPARTNEPVQQAAKLESFADCQSLEQHIEDTATRQMRASLESIKDTGNWWWGFPTMDRGGGMPPPMPTTGEPPESDSDSSNGPDNHTGTNNQVEGVHEADFVQNDGTRIFVLSGPRLYMHRSWPAEQLTRTALLEVEGWPREMLLDSQRNRLVIASQVYEKRPGQPTREDGVGVAVDCVGFGCAYTYGDTLKVTVVDVSDSAAPRVLEQVYLPGGYLSARRVEGAVRLVLSDPFRWPNGMSFHPEYSPGLYEDKERLAEAVDALIAKNEQLIRGQTLEQWLPPGRRVDADGKVKPLAYACSDFMRANAPTGVGFVTVLSMNLDSGAGAGLDRTSLVAAPGEVYASKDSLYLATNHWWWWPEAGQKDFAYLHKFDIREPGRATYVGSGTMEGHIVNQFALDEHEGVLRVAATVTTRVMDPANPWGRPETVSRVSTFREDGGRLVELGRSEDLAKGESIFSARFVGKKGYIVTFLRTDPLFTFDLSDPAHPRKVGELKVPGFSTYIHPVGDTHLLALGEHRDEDGGWNGRAVKLTLFDVRDLAAPKEAFTQIVGTQSGGSEALYNHKAFNYFPAKGLLAVPFYDWEPSSGHDYWYGFRSELRLFRVDTTTGITPLGAMSMKDAYQTLNHRNWTWYWQPTVRRSVMADDYVYAITDAGLRVSRVDALQTPVATSLFEPPVMR